MPIPVDVVSEDISDHVWDFDVSLVEETSQEVDDFVLFELFVVIFVESSQQSHNTGPDSSGDLEVAESVLGKLENSKNLSGLSSDKHAAPIKCVVDNHSVSEGEIGVIEFEVVGVSSIKIWAKELSKPSHVLLERDQSIPVGIYFAEEPPEKIIFDSRNSQESEAASE